MHLGVSTWSTIIYKVVLVPGMLSLLFCSLECGPKESYL